MIDLNTARLRAGLLQEVRNHFTSRGFLEVDTPHLAPLVIPEPTIELFASNFSNPYGKDRSLYLLPSPEYWMKKLLKEFPETPLFQLAKSFRNREQTGRLHNCEFTMLEWYGPGHTYIDNITETEGLIIALCEVLGQEEPQFTRLSMAEAFAEYASLELAPLCTDGTEDTQTEALREEADVRGIRTSAEDSWNDLFQRLFLSLVEPALPTEEPLFLYDYPAGISCLAAEKAGTPWRERWELYWKGIELANCYSELIGPEQVERLLRQEAAEKRRIAAVPVEVDDEYWRTFEAPYPSASGVALGFDRLLMLLAGKRSLDEVIYFPFTP